MLKIYSKLDEVPEALREHYALSDGRYVPQLSDDHPVLVHNKTLVSEKSTATTKIRELEADVEEAKRTSLPRGHVAIAKADAQLLDEVKALGPVADVKVKLTEYDTLKADLAKRQRGDTLRSVAKDLGYNADAFALLPDLPDFESREKDGKREWVAKVKTGDVVTERPAKEFIESADTVKPFLPALQVEAKDVDVPTSGAGGTVGGKDAFAAARDFGKSWNENAKAGTDVTSRFGFAKPAAN